MHMEQPPAYLNTSACDRVALHAPCASRTILIWLLANSYTLFAAFLGAIALYLCIGADC